MHLYLASRSPRRSQLLAQLGLRFEVLPGDIVEQPGPGQPASAYVLQMARGKALAAARAASKPLPVLGADTEVVVDGEILGKPAGREDGIRMLMRLAGREHAVYSGVAVLGDDRCETALSVTQVWFGDVSAPQAAAYWETGEPADKAGGYAIQGLGARFVRDIHGSYSGVMGLPLYETAQLLERFGVHAGGGEKIESAARSGLRLPASDPARGAR
jgi:septum formation protein